MDLLRNRKSASNIKHLGQKPIISENQDDDICAICMGSYENMSHPNECFHKYCFGCLEEWTKIKPECPLCLKKITSIIHSFQIDGTSEKYSLPQPDAQPVDQIKNVIYRLLIILWIHIIVSGLFILFKWNFVLSTLELLITFTLYAIFSILLILCIIE